MAKIGRKECEHPKSKGKPEECSPQQIKECQGEVNGIPVARGNRLCPTEIGR